MSITVRQKDSKLFTVEAEILGPHRVKYWARRTGIYLGHLDLSYDDMAELMYIADVHVKTTQRRQGIATALLDRARQDYPDLVHSSLRTREGQAWALSTGESLPRWELYNFSY